MDEVLTQIDVDRIIEMDWEDRTSFDGIQRQYGITEAQVIKIMRNNLKRSSFKLWRMRAHSISIKHEAKRDESINRFKCSLQKIISQNKISKR